MVEIRRLFREHGLLDTDDRYALAGKVVNPWVLRAEALDHALEPQELALALGHIAKHRSFRSNRKGQKIPNEPVEARKAKSGKEKEDTLFGVALTRQRLEKLHEDYRTVGEMFARNPHYVGRKRNREKDYTRSIGRTEHEAEVRMIFAMQRRYGNELADERLEQVFCKIAFDQRPLWSSLALIGDCPFVSSEKRASAFAPSFEEFRFLSKIVMLRIVRHRGLRPLSADEIRTALGKFGSTKTYTWLTLRKMLELADDEKFDRISPDNENRDFVSSKGTAAGTKTLVDILKPVIGEVGTRSLLAQCEPLDAAIAAIAFNEDIDNIREALSETGLPGDAAVALS